MKVLVTHPGRQHSHQAALGLAKARALAGYWSGVPATSEQFERVPVFLKSAVGRYRPVALPGARNRWMPWTPAMRRLGDRLPRGIAGWNDFAACRMFDRWVARGLRGVEMDAVLACEISARTTFVEAKRLGKITLLDAPSFHHLTQDRLTGVSESARLHARIARIKDEEIALANHILTVSELARESYVAAGIATERVHALDLGADLGMFTPPKRAPLGVDTIFLFCGAMLRRKGFDVLMRALESLGSTASWRLRIAGPIGDGTSALDGLSPEVRARVEAVGALPQERLADEMRRADCLVLPSRHDSYGMVVAEGLACGLPAIVSERVGAKSLIHEQTTGWVVPTADVEALLARLRWCTEHPAELRAMRADCRRVAETATWEAYHARLVALMSRLVGEARP